MRKIYLIRHAMPDIPIGERWCIGGQTDIPLGKLGRLQAALLPFMQELDGVSQVFCSTLIRARETALPLCPDPVSISGLEEQRMGVWDGLPFTEIMRRFPELYAARESDSTLLPDGAEADEAVRLRMQAALLQCLRQSTGDIAVVSHKSVIASVTGQRSKLGYTSVSVLEYGGEAPAVKETGRLCKPDLNDKVCLALLKAAGADADLIAHCEAVAALADELCAGLKEKGIALDAALIHRAALLHDLARAEKEHAALGAVWLKELGYPEIAEIVRQHHDPDSTEISEAAVVFIADKAVQGSARVPIAGRFDRSLTKCKTPEARAAHERRLHTALTIQNEINRLCGEAIL